jgi:peptide/nickel transport system substrate-binding protein
MKANEELDTEKRKALYDQAIKLITERALQIPLHSFVVPYAFIDELDFKAYPDEMPRFYWAKWK